MFFELLRTSLLKRINFLILQYEFNLYHPSIGSQKTHPDHRWRDGHHDSEA